MRRFAHFWILILLAAGVLAGCSRHNGPVEDRSDKDHKLYIYNWSYYTPEGVVEAFEKQYGCTVVLDYFASNEEMYAKMKAAGTGAGYDIVVPSGDYVSIMKMQDMLEPIDHERFPNARYISPLVREKATYDPDMAYSVPYFMGAAGIAVNKERVHEYPRDWSVFGEKPFSGRMCMMDDMREVLGDALKYLGYSVNTKDAAQLAEARDLVNDHWKPNLVKFDAEGYAKSFQQGEFDIVQGYAEGVFEEMPEDEWDQVDFFIPEEGGPMYIDNLCIPKGARHYSLAMDFINFITDPKNYAEFLDRFHFPSSVNTEADKWRTTVPFYTVDALKNCELKEDLGETLYDYNAAWEKIRYNE